MSEEYEIKQAKIDSLIYGFTDMGYRTNSRISQFELLQFLNKRSISGRFDQTLSDKLFQMICLDKISTMTIEEFVSGYIQFEEDMKRNAELFNIKLSQEKEIYANLVKECLKYKTEKLNEEGMCENAKVSGEITDIDIKRKLEGIREIIIKVIYNEKSEEFHFKIGEMENKDLLKKFEFKPTSRKDHFEFIMKGVNDHNKIFDIGSKVFPLNDINSQEEYLVKIVIPEIDNEGQVAAFIHAKIILFWSDYKFYEHQKKKSEKKIQKLIKAANKANEYLKMIMEIYGDLTKKQADLVIDFNNEKLMEKKGTQFNVDFNNTRKQETNDDNYLVEFNNIREIRKESVHELNVEFNNTKEVVIKTEIKKETTEITKKEEEIEGKEEKKEDEKPNTEEQKEEIKNEGEQNPIEIEQNINLNTQVDNLNLTSEQENIISQAQDQYNYEETNINTATEQEINFNEYNAGQGGETFEQTQNYDFGNTNNMEMTDEYKSNILQLVGQGNVEGENMNMVQETDYRTSVNEAVINESTKQTMFSHSTLKTKVLPIKINKVIVDSNVKTLPVIVHPPKVVYDNNYNSSSTYNEVTENFAGQGDYQNLGF